MTAHFSDGIVGVPFTADVDLTAWQYRLVIAASTNGNVSKFEFDKVGGASTAPIGILLNDPSAGQEAAVQCLGFTKAAVEIVSACDLKLGVFLRAASLGALRPASVLDTTSFIMARYLGPRTATAGSYYGNVLLLPMTPVSGMTLPDGL